MNIQKEIQAHLNEHEILHSEPEYLSGVQVNNLERRYYSCGCALIYDYEHETVEEIEFHPCTELLEQPETN